MQAHEKHIKELCWLLSSIESEREARQLLTDLFTPAEINALAERWQLIKLLSEGTSQRDIAKKLHISVSTVTRGSRALQYGSGGFKKFLEKSKKKHTS